MFVKRGGGVFGGVYYFVLKVVVLGFFKNFVWEVGKDGIIVNCVVSGFVNIDIWRFFFKEDVVKVIDSILMGCSGEMKEIVVVIMFLVIKEVFYIIGEEIDINGGLYMD